MCVKQYRFPPTRVCFRTPQITHTQSTFNPEKGALPSRCVLTPRARARVESASQLVTFTRRLKYASSARAYLLSSTHTVPVVEQRARRYLATARRARAFRVCVGELAGGMLALLPVFSAFFSKSNELLHKHTHLRASSLIEGEGGVI